MIDKNTCIIMIGASGSGKDTQAEKLAQELGFKLLVTGDILRHEVEEKTDFGLKIKDAIEQGRWLSDEFVNEVLKKNLTNISDGVITDGSPRTRGQAEFLDKILGSRKKIAIYLKVDRDELTNRLLNRRICEKCGKLYMPPKSLEIKRCEKCGGRIIKREDDNEEAIRKRLSEFDEKTLPVVDYYKEKGELVEINGDPPIPEVWKEIKTKLNLE